MCQSTKLVPRENAFQLKTIASKISGKMPSKNFYIFTFLHFLCTFTTTVHATPKQSIYLNTTNVEINPKPRSVTSRLQGSKFSIFKGGFQFLFSLK